MTNGAEERGPGGILEQILSKGTSLGRLAQKTWKVPASFCSVIVWSEGQRAVAVATDLSNAALFRWDVQNNVENRPWDCCAAVHQKTGSGLLGKPDSGGLGFSVMPYSLFWVNQT